MRGAGVLVALIAAGAVVPAAAMGQTCMGLPSFAEGAFQVTGEGEVFDDEQIGGMTYRGGLGFGRHNGPMAEATVGVVTYDRINTGVYGNRTGIESGIDNGIEFGLRLGWQYSLGFNTGRRLRICPVVVGRYHTGPTIDEEGIDMNRRTLGAGFHIGGTFGNNPRVKLAPTAGFRIINEHLDPEDNENAEGWQAEDNEVGAHIMMGLGAVFGSFAIQPNVRIPVGFDRTDAIYGIKVTMGFGRGGATP